MDEIIRRYDADLNYRFLDTKLDLLTGENFSAGDAWYKQKNIIFCWIQGRGMEALAKHILYFKEKQDRERVQKLRRILAEVTDSMEKCRRKNHGRLYFMMDTGGNFLKMDSEGRPQLLDSIPAGSNYSDLFYSKGLLAAGAVLKNERWFKRGKSYLQRVIRDILAERFATDQQMFDPANPVLFTPGKLLQGPKMIALSGTALGIVCDEDRSSWERRAKKLLKTLFERYFSFEDKAHFKRYDFWEAVDKDLAPYYDNNKIICDPGHGLEFAGLSLKNLLAFRGPSGKKEAARCRKFYADLLEHLFDIGFAPPAGGIIKSFDLVSRRAVNTDMPWWSLPETIRAAAYCYKFTADERCVAIMRKCLEAFFEKYVRYDIHQMAVQTRNCCGEAVAVIPATPDADPGYHTNISLIDALPIVRELGL